MDEEKTMAEKLEWKEKCDKNVVEVSIPLSFDIVGNVKGDKYPPETPGKWNIRLEPIELDEIDLRNRQHRFLLRITPYSPITISNRMFESMDNSSALIKLIVKEAIANFTHTLCRRCIEKEIAIKKASEKPEESK